MSIPSTIHSLQMLTSMFRDEWTGVIDIQLSLAPVLRFRLFGEEYSVTFQIATATVNAYISFGGNKYVSSVKHLYIYEYLLMITVSKNILFKLQLVDKTF